MRGVQRGLRSVGRAFVFGFSAALGAWLAVVLLGLVLTLILRPWR